MLKALRIRRNSRHATLANEFDHLMRDTADRICSADENFAATGHMSSKVREKASVFGRSILLVGVSVVGSLCGCLISGSTWPDVAPPEADLSFEPVPHRSENKKLHFPRHERKPSERAPPTEVNILERVFPTPTNSSRARPRKPSLERTESRILGLPCRNVVTRCNS